MSHLRCDGLVSSRHRPGHAYNVVHCPTLPWKHSNNQSWTTRSSNAMASGGSWWPSLGWASLPSFDSFTTRHWQRRLLRYLIKRTLAGFLSIPEEDIEKSTYLDADLGSGSLRLRDVELNQEVSRSHATVLDCLTDRHLTLRSARRLSTISSASSLEPTKDYLLYRYGYCQVA